MKLEDVLPRPEFSHSVQSIDVENSVVKKVSKRKPTKKCGGPIRPLLVSIEFLSYDDARALVILHGITLKGQYKEFQKNHENLPQRPDIHYAGDWHGWLKFFNLPEPYETLEECKASVVALNITTDAVYKKRRVEDPRLPADLALSYPDYPGSIALLLGTEQRPYATYEEASEAAVRLRIRTRDAYVRKRKRDPQLPRNPSKVYPRSWKGWADYLKIDVEARPTPEQKGYYATCAQFKEAVKLAGIRTQGEYRVKCRQDPRMPRRPEDVYVEEWDGWGRVMAGKISVVCTTWQEAREVSLPFRFISYKDYNKRYSLDKRLPSDPRKKYSDFPGYDVFLMPDVYQILDDVRVAAQILRLKNRDEYREACLKYPVLPKEPEIQFATEWQGWPHMLGLPTPYPLEELKEIVQLHGCQSMLDFKRLWRKLNDPRVPYNPETDYEEWVNAYDFFGTELPARLQYISEASKEWVEDIQLHLDRLEVKGQREQALTKFLRHYIEPNDLGRNVREFLTSGKADVRKYKEFLDAQGNVDVSRRTWFAVNEYLDSALKRHFTEEDEQGYVYRVLGAANPFATIEYSGSRAAPSESVKPVLAYHFVEEIRNWIVPEGAKSLSDLVNVHGFDGDYHPVPEELIDPSDPNCVYRKTGGQFFIWYPANWLAVYALVSVPARGRQIMYNDSGESDEYIAEAKDGKLDWVKNPHPLATLRRQQGFVTHSLEGDWGMHFTSNKTSYDGAGYSVAWIPDKLAYWMTVLRDWQRKYNPVNKLTEWIECANRCNLSKKKLANKIPATFLFRGWLEHQPPTFAGLMTTRLAAALYHTQPNGLELATFDPKSRPSSLVGYASRYTPHSMRVSLITAYVVSFGVPISIIMKIAGHSSIIMTIYYTKLGTAEMRFQMAEGEKRSLLNKANDMQLMIEQRRIDELHSQLVANSEEALAAIFSGQNGTQLVRDYGICPFAGARCADGGEIVGAHYWGPAPAGYLGMQNCPRCRHFVSGPVFLGGLAALWNEISLNVNMHWGKYSDLDADQERNRSRIQELDYQEVECVSSGKAFDERERLGYEAANRKLHSEMEGVATKLDMFLCDLHAITKLIEDSRAVLNKQASQQGTEGGDVARNRLQLIATDKSDLEIHYHESSLFHQLNEVCVNATIYQSASAVLATPRRSQIIDRMAAINSIKPRMFLLSEQEQLALGNQVTDFFFKRLKSWERVSQLASGQILLEDLDASERITKLEFEKVMSTLITGHDHQLGSQRYSLAEDAGGVLA
ncbi:VPA1269 family protein [Pseudomonas graminis]|uniref:gamma-mobile-trio integrase GmtZ n=1 Tax=Pseudomonas graminis TaxID=158627 RepID=UPI00234BE4D9|nr:VPA1269 family protein [Pseudomonas graminis]MDC6379875.1 VPA1269 family protein [Pseudomonas graminis]